MGEMHANLVGAASRKTALEKCRGHAVPLERAVVRQCRFTLVFRDDGHFGPIAAAATDITLDITLERHWCAPNEGVIGAFDGPGFELRGQRGMRFVGLCRHDKAARILVEAMDDTWPPHATDPRQAIAAMRDQGIHQRSVRLARTRMNCHAGRFVDHQKRIVLVEDIKRDRFAL